MWVCVCVCVCVCIYTYMATDRDIAGECRYLPGRAGAQGRAGEIGPCVCMPMRKRVRREVCTIHTHTHTHTHTHRFKGFGHVEFVDGAATEKAVALSGTEVCLCACVRACVRAFVCVHACMHACMHACVRTGVCAHIERARARQEARGGTHLGERGGGRERERGGRNSTLG